MNAADILKDLIAIRPDFRAYWEGDNNFRGEDGSFTAHGVFAQFTQFFRDRYNAMSQAELEALGRLLKQCETDATSKDAAYSCFLENIAGDAEDKTLAPYLPPKATEFINQWRH